MASQYRALLIGNSTYPADEHNLQQLKGPVKDITALHHALVDRDAGLFADLDVTLLAEVDSARAIRCLGKFFAEAARDDVLLVYFSGHGKLDQSGRLYLCMSDTDSTNLLSTSVSSVRINEFVDASRARNVVIVLDCCHAGAYRGGELGDAVAGPGRYVLTSCRGTQLANDATVDNGTSLFTQHLVDGLVEAATDQDGDGYVTFSDLYAYVERRLRDAHKQIPQRRVEGDGELRLARRRQSATAEVTTAGEAAPVLEVARPGQLQEPAVGGPLPASNAAAGKGVAEAPPATGGPQPVKTRRKMLFAAAATLVIALAGLIVALSLPSGSRPGWLYNTGSAVYAQPVIVNGVAYVGSTNGRLYALDAGTGAVRWQFPQPGKHAIGAVWASPVVAGNVVYVGSDDGRIYALKATTGVPAWSKPCYKLGYHVRSTPVFMDDIVYAISGGHLCALKTGSGARYWNPVPIGAGASVSSPTVASDIPGTSLNAVSIYVGSGDSHVDAVNANSGAIRWQFPRKGQPGVGIIDSQPAISSDGSTLYVATSSGHLYALAAGTGRILWEYPAKNQHGIGSVDSQPAVADDGSAIYFASGFDVYALDASSGTPMSTWKADPTHLPNTINLAGPQLGTDAIYVGSGKLVECLNRTSGARCWNPPFIADNRVVSTFAVDGGNGNIYFGTLDGKVYSLTVFGRPVNSH